MKKYFIYVMMLNLSMAIAQTVTLNPTVTPAVFQYNEEITVTYDVTGKAPLNTLSNAWIWVWIPGKNLDAKYNINPATTAADIAKFTKSVVGSVTTWSITFKPSDFFNGDISGETQIGMLLKANDWAGGQTSDYLANLGFRVKLNSPLAKPLFVEPAESINIQAETSVPADFELYVNEVLTNSQSNIQNFSYTHIIEASPETGTIRIKGTRVSDASISEVSFSYILKGASPIAARPSGIIPGINYGADPTKVTLCLWAPEKSSAYVVGDISNWDVLPANIMNHDGEFFWIELSGLTSGQEYGFQYLVDETIRIADPYADKILDPDDQYIPAASYPSLKPYPSKALSGDWYKNRVSVFQTNQTSYVWQVPNFVKPKKESLVIYELLLRDFFGQGNRNYQTLIDTLSYFKRLGINAIQLLPVMEFNGNESWGYNPTFMFAPDKYYGTKNKLKEFIDKCHQDGIAVIFDIAMNHQDVPNSYAVMDFNFSTFKPNPTNKWFNVNATHPFSVFNDMNHESLYTKKYLDTVNYYWINEYKIDGYRFDLSKGFTQRNNPSDVNAWSAYDDSRVAILKRMADKIWDHSPDTYVILEHLAVNQEEKELAEYRAGEGKGIMLWGKMTDQYNQNTMGFASGNDISGIYHGSRSWTAAHLVGYMESHDEERLMFKNLTFGNSFGGYNTALLNTAIDRMKAANLLFLPIPGPKMIWEYGEVGFDLSINRCENGVNNPPGAEGGDGDCRLSIKPPFWDYAAVPKRVSLFKHNADLIRLKKKFNVFQDGAVTFASDNLVKQGIIRNRNYTVSPADSALMSVVVASNFDVLNKSLPINFPHTGTWFDYYTGEELTITTTGTAMNLVPGGFKMFTNVKIKNPNLIPPPVTGIEDESLTNHIYPNPVGDFIQTNAEMNSFAVVSTTGTKIILDRVSTNVWDARQLASGFYVGLGKMGDQVVRFKIIKK